MKKIRETGVFVDKMCFIALTNIDYSRLFGVRVSKNDVAADRGKGYNVCKRTANMGLPCFPSLFLCGGDVLRFVTARP